MASLGVLWLAGDVISFILSSQEKLGNEKSGAAHSCKPIIPPCGGVKRRLFRITRRFKKRLPECPDSDKLSHICRYPEFDNADSKLVTQIGIALTMKRQMVV